MNSLVDDDNFTSNDEDGVPPTQALQTPKKRQKMQTTADQCTAKTAANGKQQVQHNWKESEEAKLIQSVHNQRPLYDRGDPQYKDKYATSNACEDVAIVDQCRKRSAPKTSTSSRASSVHQDDENITDNENATLDHSTNLLDLNDDCLLMIFDYLDLEDILRMRSLNNKRLHALGTRRIAQQKQLTVEMRTFPACREVDLKLIGANLRTLVLDGDSVADYYVLCVLRPLCKGAVGGALRELTLGCIRFDSAYNECLLWVAPQLHYLDLSGCHLTEELLTKLLDSCVELKELNIVDNSMIEDLCSAYIDETKLRKVHITIKDEYYPNIGWMNMYPSVHFFVYGKYDLITVINEEDSDKDVDEESWKTKSSLSSSRTSSVHQEDENVMITENENATLDHSTNLLDLSDRVLMMIFDYLDFKDILRMLSLNNKRLHTLGTPRIAQQKELKVEMRTFPECREVDLKLIGANLRTLVLNGYSVADYYVLCVLRPLCKGAVGGALRELTLGCIRFDSAYNECLLWLAPQLHYLDLSGCHLTEELLTKLLDSCVELKELNIVDNFKIQDICLPCIDETKLRKVHIQINDEQNIDINWMSYYYPSVQFFVYDKYGIFMIVINERNEEDSE